MNNITTTDITENSLTALHSEERVLETFSEMLDKEGLTQCIRLLSTHIALYKKEFGELSPESYAPILDATELGADMIGIFESGMQEAVSTLGLIVNLRKQQEKNQLAVTIN